MLTEFQYQNKGKMMVNTNVIDIICDEFTAEEFIDKTAPLATVIVLNEQYDSGYFIPVSTMAKCGWLDFNDSELIEHTFLSGTTEQGILIRNPRMLVCPKTDLYQYDVKASKENQTKVSKRQGAGGREQGGNPVLKSRGLK